jgi:hypothetical protein
MLFFELFPAFMMLMCIPVGVWLVMMDRAARRPKPIEEQTTHVRIVPRLAVGEPSESNGHS